jgi:murein DD-endopeptidase MepM/ murein hydrolase activator NlpD
MHKDDKFYTFLLSHSTKSKIYIRPVQIRKKSVHTGIASLVLIIGIFSIGFSGFIKDNLLTKLDTKNSNDSALLTQQINFSENNQKAEYKSFNYDRPASSEVFDAGSGGPFSELAEDEEDEQTLEGHLKSLEAKSNPAYLPTMWAHAGKINNEFGYRRNPFNGRGYEFHAGMDIDGNRGDLVASPANGTVTIAGWEGGYGNLIEIDHGNGIKTRYGHLSGIGVQVGDTVKRGQLIGLIGSTGRSTGPHLHYEVRLNDKPINPRRFLPPVPSEIKASNGK